MISFLPGRESREVSEACALRYIVQPAMQAEAAASVIQTANHAPNVCCCEATSAANSAVSPMATCPQPGTAVKADARSIVSRMKRRLSIARSWSAGGSPSCGFSNVCTTAIPLGKIHPQGDRCQVLCETKHKGGSPAVREGVRHKDEG